MSELRKKAFVAVLIFATLFACVYFYHRTIQLPITARSIITFDDDSIEYRMTEYFEPFLPREYIRIITDYDHKEKPITDP